MYDTMYVLNRINLISGHSKTIGVTKLESQAKEISKDIMLKNKDVYVVFYEVPIL